MNKKVIALIFLFTIVLITCISISIFTSSSTNDKNLLQKKYRIEQLENIFSMGISTSQTTELFGQPFSSYKGKDGNNVFEKYIYKYQQGKIADHDSQYGNGFFVQFENGIPVCWDLIDAPCRYSPIYTEAQLDKILHRDMESKEVIKILGYPTRVLRTGKDWFFFYRFNPEKIKKEGSLYPTGVLLNLINKKVDSWGLSNSEDKESIFMLL